MNEITVTSQKSTVKARDLLVGQYGIVHYSYEEVVVVRTILGLVGLDGHHSWDYICDLDVTPIKSGETITIEVGE